MDNKKLNQDEVLKHHGGITSNNFKELMESLDPSYEIDLIKESPYFSPDNLPNYIKRNDIHSILSLNTQSLNAKHSNIKVMLELFSQQGIKFTALVLQETWLNDLTESEQARFELDGYTLLTQGKSCSAHGGLAVYVDNNYNATVVDTINTSQVFEGMFVEIKAQNSDDKLIIANCYRPPINQNVRENLTTFYQELQPFLEKYARSKSDVILAGDSNINLLKVNHEELYAEFLDILLNQSFFPQITLPTRLSNRSCTLIDNIYVKLSPAMLKSDAGVIVSTLSDHFPYFITINKKVKKNAPPPKYVKMTINSDQAKHNMLTDLTNAELHKTLENNLCSNPNDNYNILEKHLLDTKQKHFPTKLVKYNKHKHKKSSWITQGIIKSIAHRDRLYLDYKSTPTDDPNYCTLQQNLKTFNIIIKKTIKDAKAKYLADKFEKYKYDMKKTWQTINEALCKNRKEKKVISKLLINEETITDSKRICTEFNNFFANIGQKLADKISPSKKINIEMFLKKEISSSFKFKITDIEYNKKVLNKLRSKPSAGYDGISVILLKFLSPALLPSLTLIINQSLVTGLFPNKLKLAKVVPLFKKGDDKIVDNYRPLSLLPSISKLFEKIVFNQLFEYFTQNNLFHNNQYGFRQEHSTEHAALELADRVLFDLDNKNASVAIFMDLSKAFDTLDHSILLKKLNYYGVQGVELNWFNDYLSNRSQYVELSELKSDTTVIKTGVPQGSILGPLLFLIYMNDISCCTDKFEFILYADDTTLYATITIRSNNTESLNIEIDKVNLWLAINKLSLNVSKTKYMLFHALNKDLTQCIPNLIINGNIIERVSNFNFLGISFNENMSWKTHLNKLSNKLAKISGVLNRMKNILPTNIMRTLYHSMVHSHMNYGILAWGFECSRIVKIQKKLIRIITCAKYNAHTEPLFKAMDILKVDDLFNLNALKFYYNHSHDKLPHYFKSMHFNALSEIHPYNTRFNHHIPANHTRMVSAQNCIRHYISKILSKSPQSIISKISTHSLHGFTNFIKEYISYYSETCALRNCYICGRE